MDRKELAISMHDRRFNCAQSVACAFSDAVDVNEKTLFRVCEGFGRGMGSMDGTCGALTGAIVLAGLISSDGDTDEPKTKEATYDLVSAMSERFKEKTGARICRDLKGADTGKPICSCPDCIRAGVEVVEEFLIK
jgi:C_GCAxxG_C_C family probable redox protein